jgi:hypothetical protein
MFLQLPEIKIDRDSILNFVSNVAESDWISLSKTNQNYIFHRFQNHPEIVKLTKKLSSDLPLLKPPIRVMRFLPGCGLPIHKDFPRNAAIQIPLSYNCKETPTLFFDEELKEIGRLEWNDDSAWLFNTQINHSIDNCTNAVRYMLIIPFFEPVTFEELVTKYTNGNFFTEEIY